MDETVAYAKAMLETVSKTPVKRTEAALGIFLGRLLSGVAR